MRLLVLCALAASCIAAAVAVHRGPAPVTAGTAVALGVDELVDGSALVVEARVLSATPRLDPRGRIETAFELLVERTFWGEPRTTRTVVLPGGVLPDGRGMLLSGVPHPSVGERTILFLSAPGAGGLRMPVGLSQGRVRVLDTPGGGHLAARSHSALNTFDAASGAPVPAGQDVLDYAGLVAEIRSAAAARRARESAGDER